VSPAGVEAGASINRNVRGNASGALLGLTPVWSGKGDDPAIAVDHRRDAHVNGPADGPATLDGSEATNGKVLFMLTGAGEPTIVRDVKQKIDRRGFPSRLKIFTVQGKGWVFIKE